MQGHLCSLYAMYVRLAIVLCTRSPPAKKVLKPLLFCPEKPTRDKTLPGKRREKARVCVAVGGARAATPYQAQASSGRASRHRPQPTTNDWRAKWDAAVPRLTRDCLCRAGPKSERSASYSGESVSGQISHYKGEKWEQAKVGLHVQW